MHLSSKQAAKMFKGFRITDPPPILWSHTQKIFNICSAVPPKSFKLKEDVFLVLNYQRNFQSRAQLPRLVRTSLQENPSIYYSDLWELWMVRQKPLTRASCLDMAPQATPVCSHSAASGMVIITITGFAGCLLGLVSLGLEFNACYTWFHVTSIATWLLSPFYRSKKEKWDSESLSSQRSQSW